MSTNVKQVILMRRDLRNTDGQKVRSGKLMSQSAHAAMIWLANRIKKGFEGGNSLSPSAFSAPEQDWLLNGSFTKIVLGVDSEQELQDLVLAASRAGITTEVCTDNGATELGGVKTVTCAAIGPDYAERIDPITRHLKGY